MGLQSASGGLTKSKLELATAVPGDVVAPATFYAGDKDLKTGTLQDLGYEPQGNGCALYNDNVYIYFGDQQNRYAISRGVNYPKNSIINLFSYSNPSTQQYQDAANPTSMGFTLNSAVTNGLIICASARNIADGRTINISSITSNSGSCTAVVRRLGTGENSIAPYLAVYRLSNVNARARITINGTGFKLGLIVSIINLG